ncbi:MAG TPA: hypothetical protein VEZ20_14555 [Allosphingosinicella sp.]|nr:hypothetical protein [Allosphingosinicella sp.]
MRTSRPIAATAALLLLAACEAGQDEAAPNASGNGAEANAAGAAAASANASAPAPAAAGWDLQSSGEGAALVLPAAGGGTAIRLFCAAGERRLLVNVPSFRPVGSEERLSFGGSGDAAALVADTRGDRLRGGVSGTGAVPAGLAAFLAGPVSASYGAQTSGPHPAVPADLARGFVAACGDAGPVATPPVPGKAPAPTPAPAPGPTAAVRSGPCNMQGSAPVRVAAFRAVGTEPFWAARTEGRCVTYSHPEDQAGSRVWSRFTPGAGGGGTWEGALGGRRFALTIRPAPGCSDGMSDRRYPFAAELVVGGERRSGCAAPA